MPFTFKSPVVSSAMAIWESRTPPWVLAVTLLPSSALVAVLAIQRAVPLHQLVRDQAMVIEDCIRTSSALAQAEECANIYFGFLSNLGILLWCASAAVSLFAFVLAYGAHRRTGPAAFLLYAGVFTGVLLLDDFFMGHERVFPAIIGIHEDLIYASYAVLFAIYLVVFRKDLLRNDSKILVLSVLLFAISILIDELVEIDGLIKNNSVFHRVTEDGSKFVAINAWAVFHIRAAWRTCQGINFSKRPSVAG